MVFGSPAADFTAFAIEECGALLFCLVFLFLGRQSQMADFGLWSVAWASRAAAAIFGFELATSGSRARLGLFLLFGLAFVMALTAGARAEVTGPFEERSLWPRLAP